MALILNLETATKVCSVSLGKDSELLALKEQHDDYSHAEKLTLFIQEVLEEAGVTIKEIDAVAVSKGPGSYTGLRIGVSTAKGLCYSLEKPLIAVSTLKAMARDPSLTLPQGEGIKAPRYYTAGKLDWNTSIENAKEHRKNPTDAEWIIWQRLRAKQIGYKFRRQHPIDKYIVDFVCIEKKLVIEIDGKMHDNQKEEDESRTDKLNQKGFKVIRFANEEVIINTDNVVSKIKSELDNIKVLPFGEDSGGVLFCPMIDARRMEVYNAFYDINNNEIREVAADIVDENSYQEFLDKHRVVFFGDGAAKCKTALEKHENAFFADDVFPSAKNMITLSEEQFNKQQFEDVAYFEPYYLKDFVAGKPKKLI